VDAVGRAASASRCTSKPDILSAAHHSHHRTLSRPPGAGTGAHPRTPFREFRKSRREPVENRESGRAPAQRRVAGRGRRRRGFYRGERRRSAAWQAAGGADEEGEGGGVCGPGVFCASKIPSFLARWRVRGPAGTGSGSVGRGVGEGATPPE